MLITIAVLLFFLLISISVLVIEVRETRIDLYKTVNASHEGLQNRFIALMDTPFSDQWSEGNTLARNIRTVRTDLRIIKRRMSYVTLICRHVRTIEALLKKQSGIDPHDHDDGVPLPLDRLSSLREIGMEGPLSDDMEREMSQLVEFAEWLRREADEDEFEAALE